MGFKTNQPEKANLTKSPGFFAKKVPKVFWESCKLFQIVISLCLSIELGLNSYIIGSDENMPVLHLIILKYSSKVQGSIY